MDHLGPISGSTGQPGAAPFEATPDTDEPRTFLTLRLGGQHFALSVAPVREILDEQPVATLPEAPADVVGLIDVRGESVMVMDVSHRLGVVPEADRNRRIVVLERQGDGRRPVGVFADQVLSVVELAAGDIEPPPRAQSTGPAPRLLQGVARLGGHLVLLLDHEAMLGGGKSDLFDFDS